MRWVLEQQVFGSGCDLGPAAVRAGHAVTRWDDDRGPWPCFQGPVVFHGSLAVADRVAREAPWRPGAFCASDAFRWSAWSGRAARWLLNPDARPSTVRQIVDHPPAERFFVRPDSALKPFSGRVVEARGLTLAHLDCGFYYEDPSLPAVVAPVRTVLAEWRFVVVDARVVAGSGYEAHGHRAAGPADGEAWAYAQAVAADFEPPERVWVLDVAATAEGLRLVEINPFSGADLYACDPDAVVAAVAAAVG